MVIPYFYDEPPLITPLPTRLSTKFISIIDTDLRLLRSLLCARGEGVEGLYGHAVNSLPLMLHLLGRDALQRQT
jgi:hypothetical protein